MKKDNKTKGAQTHVSHLNDDIFQLFANDKKNIEIRLYDEKRQGFNVGDYILFINRADEKQTIKVKIKELHRFSSFKEMFDKFDKRKLGYEENEKADYQDIKKYYSDENENKYNVVGIE